MSKLDDLAHVVRCATPGRFYETIAAFNVERAALNYARECKDSNPQNDYKVEPVE